MHITIGALIAFLAFFAARMTCSAPLEAEQPAPVESPSTAGRFDGVEGEKKAWFSSPSSLDLSGLIYVTSTGRFVSSTCETFSCGCGEEGSLPCKLNYEKPHIIKEFYAEVSMYNSVPWQTDSTPCLSADGSDICALEAKGEHTCAANFLPFGKRLVITGVGACVVRDRMVSRFPRRVDWYAGG